MRVDDRRLVVRCDGDAGIGLGHVVRSMAVAGALRDRHGLCVVFAVERGGPAFEQVAAQGFALAEARRPDEPDEAAWIGRVLAEAGAEALVLDVRTDLPPSALRRWRDRGVHVAVIDDGSDRRLAADTAFFPPVPQLKRMRWDGFSGALYTGWDYLPLRRDFARIARPAPAGTASTPHVLVAMGGADPGGATALAVEALARAGVPMRVTVVVGAAYRGEAALAARLAESLPDARLLRDVADMAPLMAEADLAVVSFGMTAYELAAVGTPTLALTLTADHAESAAALAASGALADAGRIGAVGAPALAAAAARLLADPDRLFAMGDAGPRLIDGRGADRIADRIVAHLDTRAAALAAAE
jgi:spore coat polysaccharide biosynthesis protein SpsF